MLVLNHAILHAWARDPSRTNWSKDAVKREHDRLASEMRKRGFKHTTPIKFSRAWDEL